jgi:hypothetical protein
MGIAAAPHFCLFVVLFASACKSKSAPRDSSDALRRTIRSAPPTTVSAAPACKNVVLAFRPSPSATYRVRIEERKQVYESTITFRSSDASWTALETGFSLEGSHTGGDLGDLAPSELTWQLDSDGIPLTMPEERGTGKYFQSMSVFQFRPVALPSKTATCIGTEWAREWTRGDRGYSFRYRISAVLTDLARVHAEGSARTSVNRWDMQGEIEISLSDGLTGTGRLHIRGPGAPDVNVFDRVIRISR